MTTGPNDRIRHPFARPSCGHKVRNHLDHWVNGSLHVRVICAQCGTVLEVRETKR